MSALHRQLLKRSLGKPDAHGPYMASVDGIRSFGAPGMPTTSAESTSATVDPPATPGDVGSACSSRKPPDGTGIVEAKGTQKEAELGDGVLNQRPATADVRVAAHEVQQLSSSASQQPPEEAFLEKNLRERLALMFLTGPGAPRPSQMERAAEAAHLWLLVAVKKAAAAFWAAHEEQARSCCQPSLISETEIRGYLANDALGNSCGAYRCEKKP